RGLLHNAGEQARSIGARGANRRAHQRCDGDRSCRRAAHRHDFTFEPFRGTMSRRFKRAEALARLSSQIAAKRSLLVVGAGNGLVARCAEAAGADLIVVYNSGYFRLNGHPSMLGNLPIGNANEIMLELGGRSVIPVTRDVPVIGGVYGVDPTRDMGMLFEDMRRAGFSVLLNFPPLRPINGHY